MCRSPGKVVACLSSVPGVALRSHALSAGAPAVPCPGLRTAKSDLRALPSPEEDSPRPSPRGLESQPGWSPEGRTEGSGSETGGKAFCPPVDAWAPGKTNARGGNSALRGGDRATQEEAPGFPLPRSPPCSLPCSSTRQASAQLPLLAGIAGTVLGMGQSRGGLATVGWQGPMGKATREPRTGCREPGEGHVSSKTGPRAPMAHAFAPAGPSVSLFLEFLFLGLFSQ